MARWILIIWVCTTVVLCWSAYQEGQLNMMRNDLKMMRDYFEDIEKLEKRINTMQELIDYNEGVINNALNTDLTPKKALKYIEDCYIVGDEIQYEEMEKCDCDECNDGKNIWGD